VLPELGGLHVLDEGVGLLELVVLEVVDYEVEPGLGEDVHQGRQDLERVLAGTKDHEVVSEEVVVGEDVLALVVLLQHLELLLGGLAVVDLVLVAGLAI